MSSNPLLLQAWQYVNPDGQDQVALSAVYEALCLLGCAPSRSFMAEAARLTAGQPEAAAAQFLGDPTNHNRSAAKIASVFTLGDLESMYAQLSTQSVTLAAHLSTIVPPDASGRILVAQLRQALVHRGEAMSMSEFDNLLVLLGAAGQEYLDTAHLDRQYSKTVERAQQRLARQGVTVQKKSPPGTLDRTSSKPDDTTATAKGSHGQPTTDKKTAQGAAVAPRIGRIRIADPNPAKILSDIKGWHSARRRGSFQALANSHVAIDVYDFEVKEASQCGIVLRLGAEAQRRQIDVFFFLLKKEKAGSFRLVEAASATMSHAAVLRFEATAGRYRILPFTSGCRLTHSLDSDTKTGPRLAAARKKGGFEYTAEAKGAILRLFEAFDADMDGMLSREEYDLMLQRSEGDSVDNDTWEYITSTYEAKNDKLTLKGFQQLYDQLLEGAQGDDEALFANFQRLGFDRQLQPSRLAEFTLHIFHQKASILGNISVRPMPDKCLEEAVSQHLQASGKTLASLRPNVTVRYCPQPLLVIVGVDNATANGILVRGDCEGGDNTLWRLAKSSKEGSTLVPANTCQGFAFFVPENPSSADYWQPAITLNTV